MTGLDGRPDVPRASVPGLPTAPPAAHATSGANPQVRDARARDRGSEHPLLVKPDRVVADGRPGGGRRYVRRARLAAIEAALSARDWQVLGYVAQHGFVTTHQLQRFVFTSHASEASASRTARRVLARLERDGLVRSLPRRHGGLLAGSAPATWQLAPAGARLLSPDGRRYRTRTPSFHHLRHCLALADVHLQFREAATRRGETLEVAVEHGARRSYTGAGGERRWLKPDLAVTLRGQDEHGAYADSWLVEVDLGTESPRTLLEKCRAYETYRISGQEQDRTGSFPLVLWVMGSHRADTRRQQLASALVRSAQYTPGLYRFAPLEDITGAIGEVEDATGGAS